MRPDLAEELADYPRLREMLGFKRAKIDGDALDELRRLLSERERAAAERMRREASGMVRHVLGQKPPEPAPGHPVNSQVVRQELHSIAAAIDELEPEEPTRGASHAIAAAHRLLFDAPDEGEANTDLQHWREKLAPNRRVIDEPGGK